MFTLKLWSKVSRIALIIVSYRTDAQVGRMLRSLSLVDGANLVDVFVVNNSASSNTDSSLSEFRKFPFNVEIVNAPDNPGYFGAARRVLHRTKLEDYDWIVVSNADIEILDHLFVKRLISHGPCANVGLIGPSIYSCLTEEESNPFMRRRPTRMRMGFYRYCFSNILTCWLYHLLSLSYLFFKRSLGRAKRAELAEEEVYAIHGSFMIFSREYFRRGGELNFGSYMYGEEVYVAEKCKNMGLKVLVKPTLRVLHIERQSTGIFYPLRVLRWKAQSSSYLWGEFFRK